MLVHTSRWALLALVLGAGCAQPQAPRTAAAPASQASQPSQDAIARSDRAVVHVQRGNAPAKGMGATGGPAGREALRPDKSP
jgi:hypothetical protein